MKVIYYFFLCNSVSPIILLDGDAFSFPTCKLSCVLCVLHASPAQGSLAGQDAGAGDQGSAWRCSLKPEAGSWGGRRGRPRTARGLCSVPGLAAGLLTLPHPPAVTPSPGSGAAHSGTLGHLTRWGRAGRAVPTGTSDTSRDTAGLGEPV